MQMYLDRKKAKEILKKELALKDSKNIKEAALILNGDEFWNHEVIWSDGKWRRQRVFKCYFTSYWATPMLVIYYKDGKEKRIPCWFSEEDNPKLAEKMRKEYDEKMEKIRKEIKE